MTNKKKPTKCKSDCVCRATASLQMQVKKELEARDKAIAELFAQEKMDENKDTEE